MKNIFITLLILAIPVFLFAQSPQITVQPSNFSACINTPAHLKLEATGAEPLTFEWFKDSISIGNNSDILEFSSVQISDNGIYYCKISNAEGSVISNIVSLSVLTNSPNITSASEGGNFCTGDSISLSVAAENWPFSFLQWKHNGEIIPNSSNPTLYLNNISSGTSGIYNFEVANACGTTVSNDINVHVIDPVSIVTQPLFTNVCEGETATFSVEVGNAEETHNYQWLENGVAMAGETNPTLSVSNVSPGNNSMYSCLVSNGCNSIETNAAGIIVNTYPQVTASPLDNSGCLGESFSLYSTATGTPEITSQWFVNNQPAQGETNNTINITIQNLEPIFVFNAFTNGCGTVYSDTAIIIGNTPPSIAVQSATNIETCAGDSIIIDIKASGAEPLTYQWQRNGVNVYGWQYVGQNSNTLHINQIHEGLAGEYTCVVTNACGETIGESVNVSVNLLPIFADQPQNREICKGDTVTFSVDVQGTQPMEFQWVKLGSSEIIGNEAALTINNLQETDDGQYYCIVSNQCKVVHSDTAILHVKLPPQFTLQPEEMEICHGDSASLLVSVTGEEPLDLLWFRNEGALSNETDTILTFNPAETLVSGSFMCVAINECGTMESDEVIVDIGTAPSITWSPTGQSLCENEELILYSNASGENVYFQWYNNGQLIAGQTDTTLVIPFIDADMAGEFYFQAYNACATVNSEIANVIVHPAPEFNLGEDKELCEGETVTLGTNVSAQSYNWNNGLSSNAYLQVNESGAYTLAAIGENGCTGYDTVNVTFHPYHIPDLGVDETHCGAMTLNAGEGAYSYLWNTGETSQNIVADQTGQYFVTTTGDAFGCTASDTINVIILEVPNIDLGEDHTITMDSSISLSVDEGFIAYLWSNGSVSHISDYYGQNLGVGTHEVWVDVTTENGCHASDTVLITVLQNDAVNQLTSNEKIDIYPNPVQDKFFIDYNLNEKLQNIDIIDMRGSLLLSLPMQENNGVITFNLSDFKSGIYIVRISTDNRAFNYRLIKH